MEQPTRVHFSDTSRLFGDKLDELTCPYDDDAPEIGHLESKSSKDFTQEYFDSFLTADEMEVALSKKV